MKSNKKLRAAKISVCAVIIILGISSVVISIINSRKINKINMNLEEALLKIDDLNNKEDEALLKLDEMKKASSTQFMETKSMKATYDNLLSEQKKLTVDIAGKDSSVSKMIVEADENYKKKNFLSAYKIYSNILSSQPENNDVRHKRMCSLYYSNPMNSSNYSLILEDCAILKKNGFYNKEAENIETIVKNEMEGIDND